MRRSALREALQEMREAAKHDQTSPKQKPRYEPPPPPKQELPPEPPPVAATTREIEDAGAGGGVLYSKGDASAAGFRPWYWSYERDGTPPESDSAGTVTPLRASAPSPAIPSGPVSAPATPKKRSPMMLLAGIAGLVVIAGAGGAWYAFSYSSQDTPAEGEYATAPISEPAPEAPARVTLPPPPPSKPAKVETAPVVTPPAPVVVKPPPAPAPVVAAAPPVAPPPAAAPTPAPAPAAVASAETAEFMTRGDDMLATGDIASARLFYERAAEQGYAAAELALGKTYDPLFLDEVHARGIRGDAKQAAQWYRKAAAAGDPQATIRLQRLLAKYPG